MDSIIRGSPPGYTVRLAMESDRVLTALLYYGALINDDQLCVSLTRNAVAPRHAGIVSHALAIAFRGCCVRTMRALSADCRFPAWCSKDVLFPLIRKVSHAHHSRDLPCSTFKYVQRAMCDGGLGQMLVLLSTRGRMAYNSGNDNECGYDPEFLQWALNLTAREKHRKHLTTLVRIFRPSPAMSTAALVCLVHEHDMRSMHSNGKLNVAMGKTIDVLRKEGGAIWDAQIQRHVVSMLDVWCGSSCGYGLMTYLARNLTDSCAKANLARIVTSCETYRPYRCNRVAAAFLKKTADIKVISGY